MYRVMREAAWLLLALAAGSVAGFSVIGLGVLVGPRVARAAMVLALVAACAAAWGVATVEARTEGRNDRSQGSAGGAAGPPEGGVDG